MSIWKNVKRRIVEALGGTVPSSKTKPAAAAPVAVVAQRSITQRISAAIGRAFLAGFTYLTPQTQRATAIAEALGGSLLGDRGVLTQNEDIGFRPISERAGGRRTRDLTILSHREMINVELWLYGSNPLAEWLIDMPVALVVGQEINYSITINHDQAGMSEDEAQELTTRIRRTLDRFWNHPAHNIAEKAPEYARTYLVTGHLVLPITAVNSVDGVPQLDLVDAAQICGVNPLGVGTDRQSAIIPGWVRFTPVDLGAASAAQRAYEVLQPDEDGHYVPKDPATYPNADDPDPNKMTPIPDSPENPEGALVVGQCLYFRRNKLLNSMRGQGYLMAQADWLDAMDQFAWATLERAKMRNAIVWHLQLNGVTDPARLAAETAKLMGALTKPGSVYASNEQLTLDAKNANLGEADNVELGRMILTHILGSKGFPESWYSHGGGTNKSTAGEQTDVAFKSLIGLQTEFRRMFRRMLLVAYDSMAAKQAVFPKRSDAPWLSLEPIMPVIQERDVSRLAAATAQMAAGLEGAMASKLVSERTSREVLLGILGQMTGGSYEADTEAAQIDSEEAEAEKDAAEKAAAVARTRLQGKLGADAGAVQPAATAGVAIGAPGTPPPPAPATPPATPATPAQDAAA